MSENLTFYNPSVTASRATSLCTREAVLPPDSTPIRCNTLYLASKTCEKEYEQNCLYSFVVGRGFISRRFLWFYCLFSAAPRHRPTIFSEKQNLLYGRRPLYVLPFLMSKLCVKFNEECQKSASKSYKSTKMKIFLENFAKTLVYFPKMS